VAVKTSSIRNGRRQPEAGSRWRRLSVQIGLSLKRLEPVSKLKKVAEG